MVTERTSVLTGEEHSSARLREVADASGEHVALDVDGELTTYAELDGDADTLAELLLERSGGTEQAVVAVRLGGDRALAAATFAVPRAGLVFVPLDPTYPEDRVRALLLDVQAVVLLSDVEGDEVLGVPVLRPSAWTGGARTGVRRPAPEPVASIVFTSGSTGVPKGIVMTADDQIRGWLASLPGFDTTARLGALRVGSVGNAAAFYRAAVEIGATVVTYDVRRLGLGPMPEWLRDQRITAIGTVPTVVRFLLLAMPEGFVLPDLAVVTLYGESVSWDDIAGLRRHLSAGAVVHNAYGTTESGMVATQSVPSGLPLGEGLVQAGRPINSVTVHVLRADGSTCDPGELGELVVETAGGGTAYWRRPDLSAAVWTALPDGRRRVLTGDSALLRADGVLELRGRLDHVVKVSGNRIELGELETALRALPDVADAVAAARPDADGNVRLVAAVTPAPGGVPHPLLLRAALARRLPAFMLPDHVAVLDALPLLGNGKVDRSAVPLVPQSAPSRAAAPGLETDLARLWARVLGRDDIGAEDDFFELGGDSIRAARLFTEIERELGHDRPPTLLLDAPTIALLAVALSRPAQAEVLVPVRTTGTRPPLFVVHGGLGDLLFLRDLAAHLDDDQPVHGLLAPALDGLWPEERDLGELAARYLVAVRQVQPAGPLHLFGYSLGGLIAFEMARQLEQAGDSAGLLVLGDSSSPTETAVAVGSALLPTSERARGRLTELRERRGLARFRLAGRLAVNQVKHRVELLGLLRDPHPFTTALEGSRAGVPVPVEMRGDFVLTAYGRLAADYRPVGRLATRTVLLRTDEPGTDDFGWRDHLEQLEVVRIHTDHSGLVREAADETAAALTATLAQS